MLDLCHVYAGKSLKVLALKFEINKRLTPLQLPFTIYLKNPLNLKFNSQAEEVDNAPVELRSAETDETDQQPNSIADRRKLYENRSISLIEDKKKPTVSVGRQDSFKEEDKKLKNGHQTNGNSAKASINSKRTSTVFGKVSKFRHLKGTPAHKSSHIENIKNVSRQISGECDGFHANSERVAVPLTGSGGKIAVFELSSPGRLPDGVIPTLVNGSNIMDFQWNPFDNKQLVVACDDGLVKVWRIPENGLKESTNVPEKEFNAHSEKINFIKFHPLASDILLTVSLNAALVKLSLMKLFTGKLGYDDEDMESRHLGAEAVLERSHRSNFLLCLELVRHFRCNCLQGRQS
jgi:coronin-7